MTSFALEPIYGSLALALAVTAATLLLIVWVTPPTDNPAHRRRLILLRSVAAAALLLAVFRPALLKTDTRPAEASLVVAVDTSRSMTLPDGDGSDRWTTQQASWQKLAAGLAGLDESLSIRLLAYDKAARPLADHRPTALDSESPDGDLTDLAAAALATISAAEGQPIAGVVLMGDGTQTAPVQGTGAQRVIETLNSLGVPLWCVPIGPAGGESASRDVAIETLAESFQLFAGNEVIIEFEVQTRGLSGVEVPVTLSWVDSHGTVTEAANRRAISRKSNDVTALSIPVIAPPPGTYRLKVEAATQEGELVTVNNTQLAFVDVREGGGRILYLEGEVREEQTRISRSLRRFQDLDLTYQWIPADTASSWPIDFENWFRPGRFDVYVIGDLDADALGDQQLRQLAEAVSGGAGLVTLGGYQTYGAGGYASSPLADAIPVRMDPARRRDVRQPRDDRQGHLPGPVPTELVRSHPITDLGGESPATRWQQLPPQLGANDLLAPKVAPGIQVLLESPQKKPLLVVGEYGRGRTAALAFDSTYRWWRAGQRDTHKRFWRQLILWLLARENTGGDKILIETDSRRFDLDHPPEFRASVQSLDETTQPVELVAEVIDESGEAKPVAVSSDGGGNSGAIRGQLPKLAAGIYRLRVRPADENSSLAAEELPFQAIDQSRELERPMADPVYLRQLAQLTAEHGGAAFSPDEIDALVETIAGRRQQAETPIVEKFRLGDGPLSGWIVFALFAVPLCAEWFLRRRWGIV